MPDQDWKMERRVRPDPREAVVAVLVRFCVTTPPACCHAALELQSEISVRPRLQAVKQGSTLSHFRH